RRRALPSISVIRGFRAPASSSTSRTCSASCSIAEATALIPATHCESLLIATSGDTFFQPQISLILKGFVRGRPNSTRSTKQYAPPTQSIFHPWNQCVVFAFRALRGLAAGPGRRGHRAGLGREAA